MAKQELSRRKLLSGIVATGGAGALVGRGTTALFSDEETFTNNAIEASASIAGVVDLSLEIETDDSTLVYEIELPESDVFGNAENNNPAYVWVRTTDCPGDSSTFTNNDELALADHLEVTLEVECSGTTGTDQLDSGNLLEVLNRLREGKLLRCPSPDNERCLQPGKRLDLIFHVESGSVPSNPPTDSLDFELEFYGEQCRYNTGTEDPFDDAIPECDTPPTTTSNLKAISWVAFCSGGASLDAGDVTLSPIDYKNENSVEPIEVEWQSDVNVDTVVLKTGDGIENFDVTDTPQESTVRVGEGSDPQNAQSNPSPCPTDEDGPKFEWSEGKQLFEVEK
jgi:predicted ribosomally synthesized peptide with SipW-like signal peptide